MKLSGPRLSTRSTAAGQPSASKPPSPAVSALRSAAAAVSDFSKYRCDPAGYARDKLGIDPWPGVNGKKGQLELFQDIGESVRLQLAGLPAPKVFHVEAGHGVGKTYGAAALVNWFFDAFTPSITMTTAPTAYQVELLLWKNIKSQREGKGLPGRVLPDAPKMKKANNHLAYGRTTSDSGGQGTSRIQGQHDEFLLFILDEAEGIPAFVFNAVDAMMTGGTVVICLMIANPQTRSSAFHKAGKLPGVARYRLSVLDFPNVVLGAPVVKGGTSREWVNAKIVKHCSTVQTHNEDEHTFEVAWDVPRDDGTVYPAGTIFLPDAEFMFRVMGIPPKNLTAKTLITPGRYEAAKERAEPADTDPARVRYGVDAARDGDDMATLWRVWCGEARRIGRLPKSKTMDVVGILKEDFARVAAGGATDCQIRVDGGGGYGSGIIDVLEADIEAAALFESFDVYEVQNNENPADTAKYADRITELYDLAGETLTGLRLVDPPIELEADLTERLYEWKTKGGLWVKQLEPKKSFKKRVKRSPDDGDGFVLAAAPDHLFEDNGPRIRWAG